MWFLRSMLQPPNHLGIPTLILSSTSFSSHVVSAPLCSSLFLVLQILPSSLRRPQNEWTIAYWAGAAWFTHMQSVGIYVQRMCGREGLVQITGRSKMLATLHFLYCRTPGGAGHRSAYMTCSPTLTTGDHTQYLTPKPQKSVMALLPFVGLSVSLIDKWCDGPSWFPVWLVKATALLLAQNILLLIYVQLLHKHTLHSVARVIYCW